MTIRDGSVVTLFCQVTDPRGTLIDGGRDPLIYTHGDPETLFQPLQQALAGRSVGDSVQVTLTPEESFGPYDPELSRVESRALFPDEIAVGDQFSVHPVGAPEQEDDMLVMVTEVTDSTVTVDANHPLAGMTLVYALTVRAIETP